MIDFGNDAPFAAQGLCAPPPGLTAAEIGRRADNNWFPPNEETALATRPNPCAGCAVAVECAAWAIPQADLEGIWAGLTTRQRAQLRGTPTRPQPTRETCGTVAGASTHKRRNEPSCQPCNDAERAYQREGHARRRAAKLEGAA